MSKLSQRERARIINRASEILGELEKVKPMYKELDKIVLTLVDAGVFQHNTSKASMQIVDNFAGKNTSFKACGVKRWEINIIKR